MKLRETMILISKSALKQVCYLGANTFRALNKEDAEKNIQYRINEAFDDYIKFLENEREISTFDLNIKLD